MRGVVVLKKIFTWWNGATLGALFDVGRRAKKIGTDEYGNRYFEEPVATIEGRKRRYVLYNGYAEPSRVPADWHGWLHHTFDEPPTIAPFMLKAWEKPHRPNMTGTVFAWRPKNSIGNGKLEAPKDYTSWSPND